MKSSLLIIILSLLTCSCVNNFSSNSREDFDIANNIIAQNKRKLARDGFVLFGDGGSYRGTIRLILNDFETKNFRFQTVDETRRFFIQFFNDYAKPFNEDKRIRPTLHQYPITSKMLEFTIIFLGQDGQPLPPPYIAKVANQNGMIAYSSWDSKEQEFTTKHVEAFDKASRVVVKQQEGLNQNLKHNR
jgi:hypothetical protein